MKQEPDDKARPGGQAGPKKTVLGPSGAAAARRSAPNTIPDPSGTYPTGPAEATEPPVIPTESGSGGLVAEASEEDQLIGTILADRYEISSVLGRGGMGVVFEARHVILDKRVAIKVLSQDFVHKKDLVERFMHEARAASKIGHENIVDITDYGTTPLGSAFFVMEYLDGRDLATVIANEGPLNWERTKSVVVQICRALGAAHAKGIIHRDLKPDNVFLVQRGGRQDFVKVLDFGIAKVTGLEEEGRRLTKTGMIFGTPDYMSPEQASGKKPDHRVDVYALGVITYEMLTGELPFQAESFMGILTKHMFEQAKLPGEARPDLEIQADADAIVGKAMAKDRDLRFQSMSEFAAAIQQSGGAESLLRASSRHAVAPAAARKEVVHLKGAPVTEPELRPEPIPTSEKESTEVVPTLEPVPRRSAIIGYLAIAAVVAGLAAAAVVLLRMRSGPKPKQTEPQTAPTAGVEPRTRPAEPDPGRPATRPPVAPPMDPDRPGTPATPQFVKLNLVTHPSGAVVYLNGKELGTTPLLDRKIPKGEQELVFVIKKKHHRDREIRVIPRKNINLSGIRLKRGRKPRPGREGVREPRDMPARGRTGLEGLKDPFSKKSR